MLQTSKPFSSGVSRKFKNSNGSQFPQQNLTADSRSFALLSEKQQRSLAIPGPGAYSVPSEQNMQAPISINRSERYSGAAMKWFSGKIDQTPGPQHYSDKGQFAARFRDRKRAIPVEVQNDYMLERMRDARQNSASVGLYNLPVRKLGQNITVNASNRVFTYWAPSMTPGPLGYDLRAYNSIVSNKIIRETYEEKRQKILLERESQREQRKWRRVLRETSIQPARDSNDANSSK